MGEDLSRYSNKIKSTDQQSVFKRYHSKKTFMRVLPTRKPADIDTERNHVTATLCINEINRN